MGLLGVDTELNQDKLQDSKFRSSWSQTEGGTGARIYEGTVVDVNLVLWTVDVVSAFDSKIWPEVQISSPYIHSNNGEGIYAMPDVGAKCHVCIPSEGSPPFVLDFIMVHEAKQTDTEGEVEEPAYSGGRERAKMGDIYIKGRNGNFVTLHRGGVLQIGATELAQRIYIPLQNLVTDISQNYRHYNTGGSINWFLASSESENNPSTISKHTYRLQAADERASIRVSVGRIKDFVTEPIDDEASESNAVVSGTRTDLENMNIGAEPIVCEVVLAPDGFGADDGSIDKNTPGQTKLRYFFDESGAAFMRCEGSVLLRTKGQLKLVASGDVDISTDNNFRLRVKNTSRIEGGDQLDIKAGSITMQGGTAAAAHVGSIVQTPIPEFVVGLVPIPVSNPAGTSVIGIIVPGTKISLVGPSGTTMPGTITTGRDLLKI